ncbi:exopolysaccharide biosynthesis protein [Marinovum sp.]|uniref:CpsD/CapB family tyrosine-protein kinase n=1 Tax=Marinovum sp. TaxID=2024839 RepID=UPI002B26E070|nr:exopolysaccharide biosynthesis protein [Marinovum sp.]
MEKRWTRKKRAAREAGGQDPKPALSGRLPHAPEPARQERPEPRRQPQPDPKAAPPKDTPTDRTSQPARAAKPEAAAPGPTKAKPATDSAHTDSPEAETPVKRRPATQVRKAPVAETPKSETPAPRPRVARVSVSRVPVSKPRAPDSATPEAQVPAAPIKDASAKPARQQPAATETQAPTKRETQAPVAPEKQAPAKPQTPQPAAPETQTPAVSGTQPAAVPAPAKPLSQHRAARETEAPAQRASQTPAAPEAKTPKPAQAAPEHAEPAAAAQPAETAAPLKTADTRGGDGTWGRLPTFAIDAPRLERNRIITATREDPVHSAFDVLRTKLLRALRENGWTRVAITSPTEGCGKTFMAANLAVSLSRQGNCRSLVLDLDMRHPTLAKVLNISDPPDLPAFLRGNLSMQELLRRPADNAYKIGDQVAFGTNARPEPYAAELLQDPDTAVVLDVMEAALAPDVMLFDMPPALVNDDVLAARPLFDGIILVVGGGITKPQQIRDVERRLGTETPLLGVVLNRSEGEAAEIYGY